MRAKHNKKNSKNKNIENNTTTQYEEKYNDVILNDLVPEERKEEFNIQEGKNQPRKRVKKNSFKFNVGKKSKKNHKNAQEEPQEEMEPKVSKNKKNNQEVEETTQPTGQKKSKKTRPRQHHKKQSTQEKQDTAENTTNKAGHKNTKKRVHKHRKQSQNNEEALNIKEVDQTTLEENEEIEETENIPYRGEEAEQEVQDNMDVGDKNIIWSDENFDR